MAKRARKVEPNAIASITLEGFKSFRDHTHVKLSPLTVLAGANSAGKSSLVQALLLLKQTLEAPYDPGPLMLDGPLARFDDARQLLWTDLDGGRAERCSIGFDLADESGVTSSFSAGSDGPVLESTEYRSRDADSKELATRTVRREQNMLDDLEIARGLQALRDALTTSPPSEHAVAAFLVSQIDASSKRAERTRCFLDWPPALTLARQQPRVLKMGRAALQVVHLPGLRGNPERAYKVSGAPAENLFPGSFVHYVATLLVAWHEAQDPRLDEVSRALADLHLTSHITPSRRSHVEVELKVGRTPSGSRGSKAEPVNIADVGFGVSQVLPVVVALVAAQPGQLVHIEQPELHLHPRAQVALASELIRAAQRGVRLVVETHSSVLLSALQVAVADGAAAPDLVGLHWFTRDAEGATQITSAELDRAGTYGDWPVDFADIELDVARRLIEAAFAADKG